MTATPPVVESPDPASDDGEKRTEPDINDAGGTHTPSRSRDRSVWSASIVALLLALLAGVVAALAGEPRAAVDDSERVAASDERGSAGLTGPAPAPEPAHTGLLMHRGVFGVVDVVALIGVEEGGANATAVLIPPGTLVEVPSLGTYQVAMLPNLGDEQLMRTAIENALGVHLDSIAVVTDETLAAAMAPAATIEIDLHRPIRVDDERGSLSLPAGQQELSAAEAMRLITADPGQGAFDRLVVGQAVLDGWRDALAEPGVAASTLDVVPELAPLAAAARSQMRFEALPVAQLSAAPDEELFSIERDEVRQTMADEFGWALFGSDGVRPRVELLNGTGAAGVTRTVANAVVPAGGEVTLTGNVPGFGVETTQVVYYRDEARDDAERMIESLGLGTLAVADVPLGVIDLTIVIGADYPGAEPPVDGGDPAAESAQPEG